MPRKPLTRSRSFAASLVHLLWQAPLIAAVIGMFFVIVSGQPLRAYGGLFKISLVFSVATTLAIKISRHFLEPLLTRRFQGDPRGRLWIGLTHMGAATLGSLAGVLFLRVTIAPHLFDNARDVLVFITYTLLFGVLSLGIVAAVVSHREAVARAGADRELLLARRIQRSFLPSQFPRGTRLDVHAVNQSSKECSGDFYDVVPVEDGLVLAIADVSGKGVPAALLSSMLQASLRTQAGAGVSPARMLAVINALACDRSDTGQFATFFLAVFDAASLTLRFTNAGHNFPVLLRAPGGRVLLETGGLVIGMMPGVPYAEETVQLAPGDRLLIYTDGVTEAEDAEGRMFGEDRLHALLEGLPPDLGSEQIVQRVLDEVRTFLGEAEAGDDITVMAARVVEGAALLPERGT